MSEFIPPHKPSRSYGFLSLAVLAFVALLCLAAAWGAAIAVERTSKSAVEHALFLAGEDWAGVETNGLQVILTGKAPSESARFSALAAAGREVDGARVIDAMVLPDAVVIEPPRFAIELLRNEAGISLIGLIPEETDREALAARLQAIDPFRPVSDFVETAEFAKPDGWDEVLDFVISTTEVLPRSKISMDADHVAVEAIAASPAQKAEWEREIRRKRPAGLRLALDIRSPREVVSPFIVRFISDEEGARFDACTAYTEAGRNKIVSAGIAAGVKGAVDCTLGLGVPTPDWPDAVARGIQAVRDLGGGTLTFSDADVTLVAREGTPQDTFDRVTGELEADLPEIFSLHAVMPVAENTAAVAGPPEFIATLAGDGRVQLRGRVAREQDRAIAESVARARFGIDKVYAPLRVDPGLPADWAVRTLAALEALDQLAEGRAVVRPDVVTVTGTTGNKAASAEISQLLSEKLGEAQDFRVNVTYKEELDPVAAMPTPQECVADINAVLARNKITFAPGSAEIELGSTATVDRIAEILKTCPDVAMEIAGFTDSQGREEMNQALSQRRAEAIISALLARRVLTSNLTAFGYGEQFPIADNDTEAGREANRRIEFRLVGESLPQPDAGAETGDMPSIRPPSRPGQDESSGTGDVGESGEAAVVEDVAEDDPVADPAAASAVDQTGGEDGLGEDGLGVDGADADGAGEAGAGETVAPKADAPADIVPRNVEADEGGAAASTSQDPMAEDLAVDDPGNVAPEPRAVPGDAAAEAVGSAPALAASPEAAAAEPAMSDPADSDPADSAPADSEPADSAPADSEPADSAPRSQAVTASADPDPEQELEAVQDVAPRTDADPGGDMAAAPEAVAPGSAATEMTSETAVDAEGQAPDSMGGPTAEVASTATPGDPSAEPGDTGAGDVSATDQGTASPVPAQPEAIDPGDTTATVSETAPLAGPGTEPDTASAAQTETAQTETGADARPGSATAGDEAAAASAPEDAGEVVPLTALETDLETDPDPQVDGPAVAANGDTRGEAPTGIATIRPRPRPPLVVHPDLAGIRPKPRPAVIPDVPSTE